MVELTHFVRSFSDNDRLINAASRIPCVIKRVMMDVRAKRMALILSCPQTIPDGKDLIALEAALMDATGISGVRIHLEGEAFQDISEAVAGPLRDWILTCVTRNDPMLLSLVEDAGFCAKGGKVIVSFAIPSDPVLVTELSRKIERFSEQHLPARCNIEIVSIAKSTGRVAIEQVRKIEDQWRCEARKIMSRQSKEPESTEPELSQKSNLTKKLTPPFGTGSDTWEKQAERASSDVRTDKTRMKAKPENNDLVWGKIDEDFPKALIGDMDETTGTVIFEGKIEIEEMKLTKSGRKICARFFVTDDTGSIPCIRFFSPKDADRFVHSFSSGGYAAVHADVCFDARYTKDLSASVLGIRSIDEPEKRMDHSPVKRVELHCHSKMSEKDAVINVSELMEEAARMGHRACALTDHGVVQGFPEASETVAKIRKNHPYSSFSVIYGMEGYLIDDGPCSVYFPEQRQASVSSFAVLRVGPIGSETTAQVRGIRIDRNSEGSFEITGNLNIALSFQEKGMRDEGSEDKTEEVFEKLLRIKEFIGDRPVCGTGILPALGMLRSVGFQADVEKHDRYRVKFNPVAVEISNLENMLGEKKPKRDNNACSDLLSDCPQEADSELWDDVMTVIDSVVRFGAKDFSEFDEAAGRASEDQILSRKQPVYHIIILAKNLLGLYHLYRLVSESHLRYFSHRPRIPKSLLRYFREGLIVGSACERGEIFKRIRMHYSLSNSNLKKACVSVQQDSYFDSVTDIYDYFEVQPITNNSFFLRDPESGLESEEDLMNLNRLVVHAGEHFGKPVCATTDAHFLERRDGEFRKYLLLDMEYTDAEEQADLYFRTTEEMLTEFAYLGESKAQEVVITNTNRIADQIDFSIQPFPQGTFPPIIEKAADEITRVARGAMYEQYAYRGVPSPVVEERLNKELNSIIGNGFAIMYYIAYMLVKKSNEDGYIVGSRGSVGSSLVATLCGISEVNPLPPHYRCPKCLYSEFTPSGTYGSGYDMPQKDCPNCFLPMIRDGQEIPFETFLGFYGDKQPDIDLNFSSEYQSRAHHFVEELFGTSHTFRAGTIGCFAEKNAVAVINKISEIKGERINRAEVRRRSQGLIGVKRTTGQHPGGIVVVPKEMDVYEFTPIQYPANKRDAGVITTHFDFNAMHDTILKLDILGHYDPTVLRMLGDLTGIDVRTIPIPDPKVMSLFVSREALEIKDENYENMAATLGLSEMGTFMARDMIAETRPSTFFELVQLMGLSHGTDVWKGNAQDLIRKGVCTLENVIGCRDSIMTVLIQKGISNKESFDIMERVRKGKGLLPEQESTMREHGVPEWYIESCRKIKYMFPKAHAAAYAISSLRTAWFKVYYPEEYYCAFFSIRADEFDGESMCRGIHTVRRKRKELHEGFSSRKPTEKAQYYLYELIEEMYARGIEFVPFDLNQSHAEKFIKLDKGKILPPINAITSVSTAMARAICFARDRKPFGTREELMIRSGIGPSALEKLTASGVLDALPESVQIDLFSLL